MSLAQDRIELVVGKDVISGGRALLGYEIKWSVFDQPSAFSFRMGWDKTAAELAARIPPGTPCALQARLQDGTIRRFLIGLIEAAEQRSAPQTTLEFRGRDYMQALYRGFVLEETSLAQRTYIELTRKVLDLAGLNAFPLIADNSANVQIVSGGKAKRGRDFTAEVTKLSTGSGDGLSEVVQIALKTRLGERWIDFLNRQYKLAGLFLWTYAGQRAQPDGFVLTRPNATAKPSHSIVRQLADPKARSSNIIPPTNVINASFTADFTNRHDGVRVYGRGGGTRAGRKKIQGEFADAAMNAAGLTGAMVVHDDDAKTPAECEYVARRIAAEERRQALRLRYTIAGHSYGLPNGFGVFMPDIVLRILDEPFGLIDQSYYLHSVTYRLSEGGGSTTELELMPTSSLVFAEKLFDPTARHTTWTRGTAHMTAAEREAQQAAEFRAAVARAARGYGL